MPDIVTDIHGDRWMKLPANGASWAEVVPGPTTGLRIGDVLPSWEDPTLSEIPAGVIVVDSHGEAWQRWAETNGLVSWRHAGDKVPWYWPSPTAFPLTIVHIPRSK